VPRKNTADGKRRRNAKASAIDAWGRGLALRILLHSPKDTFAGALAVAAACAIVTNAVFLQSGPHPAPMFGSTVVTLVAPPSLMPRPRPAEADVASADEKAGETKAAEPKIGDPLANLVRAATTPQPSPQPSVIVTQPDHPARTPSPSPQPSVTSALSSPSTATRPPAPILAITGSRRVAAVQRALTEYGYAQLKPTGTIGPDTQAAISKFERDRRLPVTGQVSDRMVRELSTMIGHPVE
jgi:Putative peptidoglycan binding domain